MNEKEITYRWLTQADLERMLDDAYAHGVRDTRAAAIEVAHDYADGMSEVGRDCDCGYSIAGSMRGFWHPEKSKP